MKQVSADNFGLLIAYLLPGFVALWGARAVLPGVTAWLATPPGSAPTVGGFLYGTLGSTAAGLLVSTVRWAVIDRLHHVTGLPEPRWDFGRFRLSVEAFDSLVQDHYRYYQFHANMLVAVAFVYAVSLVRGAYMPGQDLLRDMAFVGASIVLFLGSRDTLRKYYRRTAAVLGCVPEIAVSAQKGPPGPISQGAFSPLASPGRATTTEITAGRSAKETVTDSWQGQADVSGRSVRSRRRQEVQ